jgi:hypothetical protein
MDLDLHAFNIQCSGEVAKAEMGSSQGGKEQFRSIVDACRAFGSGCAYWNAPKVCTCSLTFMFHSSALRFLQ